jgi:hypothetical protein
MMQTDYTTLIEAAVTDVDSGAAAHRSCGTTRRCREASGCPRCIRGLAKGLDIGIERIEVFRSGRIRLTTVGHGQGQCTVALQGIEVTIHE